MTTRQGNEAELAQWVQYLARLGYLVKGIVYITVGALAVQAALGPGGRTTGASGALVSIARQSFGQTLIGIVAVGLVGYALWRLVQALLDAEGKGTSAKGLLKRLGYLVSGLAYGALALEAWRLLLGVGVSSDDQSQELWTARILFLPLGRWLVAAGALVMFALAVNAVVVAFKRMYREKLATSRMSPLEERVADVTGIAGLLGRGTVFAVIGIFLVQAALQFDPDEAGASAEALGALVSMPYGTLILGIVAAGLVAFGAFSVVQARYRKMSV